MLPTAVRKRAEEATRLVQTAAALRAGTPPPAAAAATPTPTPAPAVTDAALQKELQDTKEELRKANDRYLALDGKYKAETPKAQADLRAALTEKKALEEKLKAIEEEKKRLLETGNVTSLSADERRLAGEDLLRVTVKAATEVAERVFDLRSKDVLERVDLLEKMSDEAYFVTLDMNVPNWLDVNDEAGFIAWLHQPDPKTKRLRMDLIKRAEAARQGNMVAEIFLAYIEKREIGAPLVTEPAPKPAANGPGKRVDAPVGGGENAVSFDTDANGKRIWTAAEITRHYREKREGLWKGKEDAWRKIEIEMFAARKG